MQLSCWDSIFSGALSKKWRISWFPYIQNWTLLRAAAWNLEGTCAVFEHYTCHGDQVCTAHQITTSSSGTGRIIFYTPAIFMSKVGINEHCSKVIFLGKIFGMVKFDVDALWSYLFLWFVHVLILENGICAPFLQHRGLILEIIHCLHADFRGSSCWCYTRRTKARKNAVE